MFSLAAAANNGQSKEAELSSQVSVYSKYKLANIKSDSRSINPRDAQESREFEGNIIWNDRAFKEAVKPFLGKGINLSTNLEISEESVKGEFIYSKPNFAYTDNTLFTSVRSTTTDHLTDYGYKLSDIGMTLGTRFEQFENLFFRTIWNNFRHNN